MLCCYIVYMSENIWRHQSASFWSVLYVVLHNVICNNIKPCSKIRIYMVQTNRVCVYIWPCILFAKVCVEDAVTLTFICRIKYSVVCLRYPIASSRFHWRTRRKNVMNLAIRYILSLNLITIRTCYDISWYEWNFTLRTFYNPISGDKDHCNRTDIVINHEGVLPFRTIHEHGVI